MVTTWGFDLTPAFGLALALVGSAQVHDIRFGVSIPAAAAGEVARFYRPFKPRLPCRGR